MNAPHCKICGTKHWGREPHAGMTKPKAVVVANAAVKAPAPRQHAAVSKSKGDADFDRKAYQRELMRKRRAAAKQGILII